MLASYALIGHSTEIDSFTLRDPNLPDATYELNELMNNYIDQSIREANSWHECNSYSFIEDFNYRINGTFWTEYESAVLRSESISYKTISRRDSIYQDFSFLKAPALYLAKLGPVVRVGDFYIGSDKFGHFIGLGYDFYNMLTYDNKSLDDVLSYSEKTEREYFGLQTTGIYSYGDLAANFDGLKLWNNLISQNPAHKNSYVTCVNNTYYRTRYFDWKEHVTAAWDEGINCSSYRDKELENFVQMRLDKLGLSCPVKPKACPDLLKLYGALAPRLITPKCFN
jgi:hypothetical protein